MNLVLNIIICHALIGKTQFNKVRNLVNSYVLNQMSNNQ